MSKTNNPLTRQSQLAHKVSLKWSDIPFGIIPTNMRLANGKSIRPDTIQEELEKAAEQLLNDALTKKHMLKSLYDGLHDDKGLEAGTQQCYSQALKTAIVGALKEALIDKLAASGKGIAGVSGGSLLFLGAVGGSVALSMSALGNTAVGWVAFLLACCFLTSIVMIWSGCYEASGATDWVKELTSKKPSDAMEPKVLRKVATALSAATQAFEIPESHSDRFAVTKTHIKREMSQWKSWKLPEPKHDHWSASRRLYNSKHVWMRGRSKFGLGGFSQHPQNPQI